MTRASVRCRRLLLSAAACLALLLIADLARPPERQATAAAVIGVIHFYQVHVSPIAAAAGVRCRFTPTCSHYAEASIRRHGLVGGSWRALKRLARCGPWTRPGTIDPPF